ncbi:hypothetical protein ACFWB0_14040 [Rhodococcus sp. NPDC060086]|uniref:hypothetical protein n=1 Tax=unclassified Rhodococcus (in: high G+C Gram-positive bacteria) TaxID=192944 RepID=UPI003658D931
MAATTMFQSSGMVDLARAAADFPHQQWGARMTRESAGRLDKSDIWDMVGPLVQ